MKAIAIASVLVVVLGLLATPAAADMLDFSGNICTASSPTASVGIGAFAPCADRLYINQAYGDTASVSVTYKDLTTPADTLGRLGSLAWWSTDYNNLVGVAWGGGSDLNSWNRIEIAPVRGSAITLEGFDLGAWYRTKLTTHAQVLDLLSGAVLIDFGAPMVGTGNAQNPGVATHFTPNVSSANGVAIEWKNSAFNVGIDNITFIVGPAQVPEPSTFALFGGAALAMLTRLAIRRRLK